MISLKEYISGSSYQDDYITPTINYGMTVGCRGPTTGFVRLTSYEILCVLVANKFRSKNLTK